MKCFACGEILPGNSRFCNMCGVRLVAPASDAPARGVIAKPQAKPVSSPAEPAKASPARKPPVLPSRAQQVQTCLDRILGRGDLPAFSHHIHEIMGALESEDASLRHLTNLILNDYSLLLTVMRTANSYPYNRSGRPICSVTHAVALLGANAIRGLASGLIFLEHYRSRSVGLTELILLSSLTASHARHLASRLSSKRLEEAHLCGMFRNLGEVLIACYLPNDYATILRRMKERQWSDREACLSVMGFSYEELGQAMARHWRLPGIVSDSIVGMPASGESGEPDRRVFEALVSFSHELTRAVYRDDPEGSNARVMALIGKYSSLLGLNAAEVRDLLEAGIADTKATFALLKIPIDDLQLHRQTDIAVTAAEKATAPDDTRRPVERHESGENLLQLLAGEVNTALSVDGAMDVSQVVIMVLEAIFRGGPFDRVLLGLLSQDRSEVRGRLGLGDGIDKLAEQFRLQLTDQQDFLVSTLLARQDVYVPPEGAGIERRGLITSIQPACFGLFPLIVDDQVIGCLYFDRKLPIPLSGSGTLQIIARLRDSAAVAISRSASLRVGTA